MIEPANRDHSESTPTESARPLTTAVPLAIDKPDVLDAAIEAADEDATTQADPAQKKQGARVALKELQEVFGPIMREREAGFNALLERLGEQGVEAKVRTTACPVQIEGRLPSGELLYFRSRHDSATLSLWRGEDDVDGVKGERYWNPDGYAEVSRWSWPEAGWLEADEVDGVFAELLEQAKADLASKTA